jgi:D-alanyl-D-alanine dipeptidase
MIVSALTTFSSSGVGSPAEHRNPISADCEQLLLVRSASWSASAGLAQRYERSRQSSPWRAVGEPLQINLGRNGMAWGRGLQQPERGPLKREGDLRTPAGVFALGPLFGYAQKPPAGADPSFTYIHIHAGTECVEAPQSPLYNRIVASGSKSSMLRADGVFQLGFVIEQNAPEAIPGAGSCVFFHVQRGQAQATSGCTSASLADLESVVSWLKPELKPLIVQLPEAEYRRLRDEWTLPRELSRPRRDD